MSENDRNVSLVHCDFHTKWGKRDKLTVFKLADFKASYLKFRVLSVLGEKFIFFQFPWDDQNFQEFQTFCVY